MEAHDLDILVLGRQANVRYVTGAPQLWIAGTRPFGPVCVVVRASGDIYLNTTDDEGVPEEISHDHLYGLTWNPKTLIDVLKKIDGAETALRVGTDAITPTFAALLPERVPQGRAGGWRAGHGARHVASKRARRDRGNGRGHFSHRRKRRTRRRGDPIASRFTRSRKLAGAVLEAMAAGGVSTPATQDAAWVTSREHPWQRAQPNGTVQDGDLVAFAAGALAGGYVGEVGRTRQIGTITAEARQLHQRSHTLHEKLIAACRPGVSTRELLAAYEKVGEPIPPMPIAHGLGLGFDPPVVSETLSAAGEDDHLDAGMVLAVTGYVWREGVGAVFRQDTVHVTATGAEVVTHSPSWPEN